MTSVLPNLKTSSVQLRVKDLSSFDDTNDMKGSHDYGLNNALYYLRVLLVLACAIVLEDYKMIEMLRRTKLSITARLFLPEITLSLLHYPVLHHPRLSPLSNKA